MNDSEYSPLSTVDLLPDTCHHDPWFMTGGLQPPVLTQVLGADHETGHQRGPAFESLIPSLHRWKMEHLGSPGTRPEPCDPGSRHSVLHTPGHHGFYLQTSEPEMPCSPETLRSCDKLLLLIIHQHSSASSSAQSPTGAQSCPPSSSFPRLPGRLCPRVTPSTSERGKGRQVRAYVLKL